MLVLRSQGPNSNTSLQIALRRYKKQSVGFGWEPLFHGNLEPSPDILQERSPSIFGAFFFHFFVRSYDFKAFFGCSSKSPYTLWALSRFSLGVLHVFSEQYPVLVNHFEKPKSVESSFHKGCGPILSGEWEVGAWRRGGVGSWISRAIKNYRFWNFELL